MGLSSLCKTKPDKHTGKKRRIWDIFVTSWSDGMPEETAHWQSVCLGSLLTWLPLCGLQTGPGSMCSYSSHSWGPNTKTSQAWSPKWQEGKSESCESAAFAPLKHLWCSKTLLSSCNTPTTFTDYVQKHFILHQKHYSTICLQLNIPLLCFASAVKEKKNLASWFISKKHSLGSFLGDMKGNLGRPHFFPWGQFARHSKKNVSSQRASTNWPDIQLILICSGEQHAAGQTRNSILCNK